MKAKARSASGRIVSKTVCGRRICRDCRCWRHVLDFGVRQWADKRRTIVRYHKAECLSCSARAERVRISRMSFVELEARRARMRQRYRGRTTTTDGGWMLLGDSWIEEANDIGFAAGDSAYDPIPLEVARAWSEELPPVTEFKPGWWTGDGRLEIDQRVALAA